MLDPENLNLDEFAQKIVKELKDKKTGNLIGLAIDFTQDPITYNVQDLELAQIAKVIQDYEDQPDSDPDNTAVRALRSFYEQAALSPELKSVCLQYRHEITAGYSFCSEGTAEDIAQAIKNTYKHEVRSLVTPLLQHGAEKPKRCFSIG